MTFPPRLKPALFTFVNKFHIFLFVFQIFSLTCSKCSQSSESEMKNSAMKKKCGEISENVYDVLIVK